MTDQDTANGKPEGEKNEAEGKNAEPSRKPQSLVRLRKTVVYDKVPEGGGAVDYSVISPQFYNSFNYRPIPHDQSAGCLAFGVTSARVGDGKTLVASNMAVSFAVANEKKSLIVDLNIVRPKLHEVYGVPRVPGFLDALGGSDIHVSETMIRNLFVLSVGEISRSPLLANEVIQDHGNHASDFVKSTLGLERVVEFRDLLYTLEEAFDVVIFDMPAIHESGLPILYLKQLRGVIVVINSGKTRKDEVDKILHHIDHSQILGFVLNRAEEESF